MDPISNPFVPGAGTPPPELAGRTALLGAAETALARAKARKQARSSILVGLRGVGKTVLLVKINEAAAASGFKASMIEAHEGKSLPALLLPELGKSCSR